MEACSAMDAVCSRIGHGRCSQDWSFKNTPQTFVSTHVRLTGFLGVMQIRNADLKDGPFCSKCLAKMYRHGRSPRRGGEGLQRYLCPRCRCTCSVLEPGMLPYRHLTSADVERCLDQPASILAEPCAHKRRRLSQAIRDFRRHGRKLLCELGTLLPLDLPIYPRLRTLFGTIESILHALAASFGTSLLGNYRSLRRAPLA